MIRIATIFGYDTTPPIRGSEQAAGIDVFLPLYNEVFRLEFEKMNKGASFSKIYTPDDGPYIGVPVGRRVVLPTGLRADIESGTYLEVANRGSMAVKQGLIFGAHIIDADYRGNIFINLINISQELQRLEFGQKIAQLLHKEVLMSEVELISDEQYNRKRTVRGEGALGSTGR